MPAHLTLDRVLLEKYACIGPCQAPYFPLTLLREDFSARDYRLAAQASNEDPIPSPLSISLHLPACNELDGPDACHAANAVQHTTRINEYLGYLEREIALQAALFDKDRQIEHVHVSGDLSTCIKYLQWKRLFDVLGHHFCLFQDDQPSSTIEVDSSNATHGYIAMLGELGFTHLNLTLRPQTSFSGQEDDAWFSEEALAPLVDAARQAQLHEVGMTLACGHPRQALANFEAGLSRLIALRPDRLSLCCDHSFETADDAATHPMEHLQQAILHLSAADYTHLGLGHFALPEGDLALAWHQGTLHYDVQGYLPHDNRDLIGLGVGAFSQVDDSYSQNVLGLSRYTKHLDQNRLPVWRGHALNFDDLMRREIIHRLLCRRWLDITTLEERYQIVFRHYFAPELTALASFVEDGLVMIKPNEIRLTPLGYLLLGQVAALFAPSRRKARHRLLRIV